MIEQKLVRAEQLIRMRRFEEAGRLLALAMGEEPDNSHVHSLLAIVSTEREEHEEAVRHAQRGVMLAPAEAFSHYVLGSVELARNRIKRADEAASSALDLDPSDADNFALLAQVRVHQKAWEEALRLTNEGLALDAQHDACTNLRAMALANLGRKNEAASAIEGQLARTPEDSRTHANMGWLHLRKGDIAQAQQHFREALRLDASNEWARHGIREALQARHWFYRPILRFFLWIGSFTGRKQAAVIFGGWLAYRFLINIAERGGIVAIVSWTLIAAYLLFVVGTWFADTLAAALLSLHPLGSLALTKKERWSARLLTFAILAGFVLFGLGNVNDHSVVETGGMLLLFSCAPAGLARRMERPKDRAVMVAYTGLIALLGIWSLARISAVEAGRAEIKPFLEQLAELQEEHSEALDVVESVKAGRLDPRKLASEKVRVLEAAMNRLERETGVTAKKLRDLASERKSTQTLVLVITLLAVVGSQFVASWATHREA